MWLFVECFALFVIYWRLGVVLHELSHCVAVWVQGGKVTKFRPWPHVVEGTRADGSISYIGSMVDDRIVSIAPIIKSIVLIALWIFLGFSHGPVLAFAVLEFVEIGNWILDYIDGPINSDGRQFRMKSNAWWVYLALGINGHLYCGISTDPERRVVEHNTSKRGSKWARAHRPLRLVYKELVGTKGDALRREHQIKGMTAENKRKLAGLEENG